MLATLAFLAALSGPLPSAVRGAEDFPRLSGPITDLTDTLSSSEEAQAQEAIVDLRSAQAIDLWVLFTDTTNPQSVTEYAQEVADRNSLGTNDVLLVVAMDDRTDALWLSDGLDDITDDEVDSIISNQVEPQLADGDFVGAIEAAARASRRRPAGRPRHRDRRRRARRVQPDPRPLRAPAPVAPRPQATQAAAESARSSGSFCSRSVCG